MPDIIHENVNTEEGFNEEEDLDYNTESDASYAPSESDGSV